MIQTVHTQRSHTAVGELFANLFLNGSWTFWELHSLLYVWGTFFANCQIIGLRTYSCEVTCCELSFWTCFEMSVNIYSFHVLQYLLTNVKRKPGRGWPLGTALCSLCTSGSGWLAIFRSDVTLLCAASSSVMSGSFRSLWSLLSESGVAVRFLL